MAIMMAVAALMQAGMSSQRMACPQQHLTAEGLLPTALLCTGRAHALAPTCQMQLTLWECKGFDMVSDDSSGLMSRLTSAKDSPLPSVGVRGLAAPGPVSCLACTEHRWRALSLQGHLLCYVLPRQTCCSARLAEDVAEQQTNWGCSTTSAEMQCSWAPARLTQLHRHCPNQIGPAWRHQRQGGTQQLGPDGAQSHPGFSPGHALTVCCAVRQVALPEVVPAGAAGQRHCIRGAVPPVAHDLVMDEVDMLMSISSKI